MTKNNVATAEAYYTAFGKKSIAEMEQYLHPDVHFVGPFAQLSGKKAVIEAAKTFAKMFNTLTIRVKFGSDDQAMIVYDFDWLDLGKTFSAAVLMTFHDGLIAKVELFYDSRPF